MREIEFRAWLKKHLKLVNVKRIDFEAQEIVYDEIDFEYEDVIREKTALFKDISLLEYTGLKDKNGVKIFEGDIIQVENSNFGFLDESNCLVEWGNCGYRITDYECEDFLSNFRNGKCEVIGNIYENKELLERI